MILMEVGGLCQLCGRPGKMFTCRLCGRLVCSRCFDTQANVCKACAQGRALR